MRSDDPVVVVSDRYAAALLSINLAISLLGALKVALLRMNGGEVVEEVEKEGVVVEEVVFKLLLLLSPFSPFSPCALCDTMSVPSDSSVGNFTGRLTLTNELDLFKRTKRNCEHVLKHYIVMDKILISYNRFKNFK
jgi:hypothetical protein